MSLYDNLLDDPRIQFATSNDQAERIANMQRMFRQMGVGGVGEHPLLQKQQPSALSGYGLNAQPFAPTRSAARRSPTPQTPPMPEMQDDAGRGFQQFVDVLGQLARPKEDDSNDPVARASKRADDAIKQLSDLRSMIMGNYPTAQNPVAKMPSQQYNRSVYNPLYRPRAMTPMEGPDTGDINPNAIGAGAPQGYYAHLRGPEGTTKNFNAVNPTSGAAGPFQFLRSTWDDLSKRMPYLGLTPEGFNNPSQYPEQHDAAIRAYTDQSINAFQKQFQRQPTMGELYSMHLLGQNGGMNVLSNPNTRLGDLVTPNVIQSNPWMQQYVDRPASDFVAHLQDWISNG